MLRFLIILPILLLYTVFAVYAERKLSAFIQDRVGPIEVGKYGLLQTIADLIKLLQKEDIVALGNQKVLYKAAPILLFASILTGFVVIPINSFAQGTGLSTGLYFLFAIVSLDVIALLMAGWGANSKFAMYGALRSAAQLISYEVPLLLSVITVLVFTNTLDLGALNQQQSTSETLAFFS